MPREIQILLNELDEAYNGPAWHGPSLRGSLRRVDSAQAAARPTRQRHNIWELLIHSTYWKYAVRRQLTGAPLGSFGEDGSNFFPRPAANLSAAAREKSWRKDLAKLKREHAALLQAVRKVRESDLDRRAAKSKYTRRQMIHGVACHDVYHAGQIQLLKRLTGKN